MILAVGDTHQSVAALRAIGRLIKELKPQVLVHTGDNYRDFLQLSRGLSIPCFCVPGNCDSEDQPEELTFTYLGRKILLVHGHQYGVKNSLNELIKRSQALAAHGVIFGHTHVPVSEYHKGLLVFNPGSLALPRGGSRPTYGCITNVQDTLTGELFTR